MLRSIIVKVINTGVRSSRLVHRPAIVFGHRYCTQNNSHDHSGEKKVRVRYAPSPTGLMHLGGLRTALFNYLFAKKHNGTFLLRIEDTDQTRLVPGSEENITEALEWAGIPYDEGPLKDKGCGPYRQSERKDLYLKHADELLEKGHAYRCFCTPERLEALRKTQQQRGVVGIYDRFCLKLTPAQVKENLEKKLPFTIRMKVPSGQTTVKDGVSGEIQFNNNFIDDQILVKSDRFPTYHLANVVDDHYMKISHVIRGEEWLPSTPKHVILYNSFGWSMPQFIHLPLLLNTDKTKLSKRQGDVSVDSYIKQGYLPSAMINFVAFLGWNPGTTQELFTLPQLVENFSLDKVTKGGSVVNKEKLEWFNAQHTKLLAENNMEGLIEHFLPFLKERIGEVKLDHKFIGSVLKHIHEIRDAPNLRDLADRLVYFFVYPDLGEEVAVNMLEKIKAKNQIDSKDEIYAVFDAVEKELKTQGELDKDNIGKALTAAAKSLKANKSLVFLSIRWALTGKEEGLEIPFIIKILGLDQVHQRFEAAKVSLKSQDFLKKNQDFIDRLGNL